MNGLFHAAREVQGWQFCFIGGFAVIRWGEPRMTQDVDVSLLTGFGEEREYIRQLLAAFSARIPNAETFALRHRVALLASSKGTPIDISLAGLPFEEEMIAHATPYAFTPEHAFMTCSAEDLIVLKAFADRSKDWMDVESILSRQRDAIDSAYILRQLTPLCELKESPHILAKLTEVFNRF